MGVIVWIVIIALVALMYFWYVTIVTRRNRVGEALAGIDVQLNQRHDLLPNLLTIAKRFMEHERGLLEEITALRARAASLTGTTAGTAAAKFAAEGQLEMGLGRLFAVAENYPDLKSHGPMIEAQRGYTEAETNIAAARRFYNSAVGDLRNATQIFPGSLIAGLAGASTIPPFFEAPAATREAVDAGKFL